MNIGFISDIHEDLESLKVGMRLLEQNNCDAIVCLGDIVGFTLPFQRHISARDANGCIDLVKDACAVVVAGNHDLYAVRRIPLYTDGFPYGENWYQLDYDKRAKLSRNRVWLYEDSELPHFLSPASVEYLSALPEYKDASFDGIRFCFSHFHFPDLTGSTLATPRKPKDLLRHFEFMDERQCLIGVSGHGHPEGCACCDSAKLRFLPFGQHVLDKQQQWLVCPCIANTSRSNGVMLLDTSSFQLDVIPLGSSKSIV